MLSPASRGAMGNLTGSRGCYLACLCPLHTPAIPVRYGHRLVGIYASRDTVQRDLTQVVLRVDRCTTVEQKTYSVPTRASV